jgi:glycosyltransferase involved in cell wall biosynthesis
VDPGPEGPCRFSFVIATLDDDGDLAPCLHSLAQLLPVPGQGDFEVIVVDQNPDDRLCGLLAHWATRLRIRHLQVDFRGASRARNLGAREARGAWVGFPDDDCRLLPDLLQQVALIAADPAVRVVTGQTVDESGRPNLLRWGTQRRVLTPWNMFACLTEATLFVDRTLFLAVGGFDEAFGPGAPYPAAEGVELMQRLLTHAQAGVAVYNPQIRMQHPSKIPPWNAWAVDRFHSYAIGDGAVVAKSRSANLHLWAARTLVAALLQGLFSRGLRGKAFFRRIHGLLTGYVRYRRDQERGRHAGA